MRILPGRFRLKAALGQPFWLGMIQEAAIILGWEHEAWLASTLGHIQGRGEDPEASRDTIPAPAGYPGSIEEAERAPTAPPPPDYSGEIERSTLS